MDNKKEKKKIVITGNMVVKFVCILGLISCLVLLIANWFMDVEVDWAILMGVVVVCGVAIFLLKSKKKS